MARQIDVYRAVARRGQREQLIQDHLSLVQHIVGRLLAELPPGVDAENLESAGALGLVEAASAFNPELGVQFQSFAYHRIRGAILDELRRNSPLPQSLMEKAARVRQAHQQLTPPVSVEDLARATGMTTDEVADCLSALRLTRTLSLEPGRDVRSAREEDPSAALEREEQSRLLADAVERLPHNERLVVTLYYREELRLKEIGAVLNLSESRVSRLLSAALHSLKESLRCAEPG